MLKNESLVAELLQSLKKNEISKRILETKNPPIIHFFSLIIKKEKMLEMAKQNPQHLPALFAMFKEKVMEAVREQMQEDEDDS